MMTHLIQAHRQWATRPHDQRFTSLTELAAFTHEQQRQSRSSIVSSRRLRAAPDETDQRGGLMIEAPAGLAEPTHWSFGQIAGLVGAPANYLRNLPAPIVADCLNYGLHFNRDIEDVGLLLTRKENDVTELRAATGPRYGRVWNAELADALVQRFGDGIHGDWRVPGEFGREIAVTKDNTTLFASDRDMFVFLADERNRIEIPTGVTANPAASQEGFSCGTPRSGRPPSVPVSSCSTSSAATASYGGRATTMKSASATRRVPRIAGLRKSSPFSSNTRTGRPSRFSKPSRPLNTSGSMTWTGSSTSDLASGWSAI
jgi:hypothetical protein